MRRAAALRCLCVSRLPRVAPSASRQRAGRGLIAAPISALLLLAGHPALAQHPASPQPAPPPQGSPPAQNPPPPPKLAPRTPSPQQIRRLKLNHETLIVAASRPGASHLAMADDLAVAVGRGGGPRLLPIAAEGGLANLRDLLFLRGVDMAIVAANVLAHAKATDALGSGLAHKIAYVAPLYGEEVHIVAGRSIASTDDLRGKKIAVLIEDGSGQFTAKDIFERLDVTVECVPMQAREAVRAVRSGAIAAAVLVASKPATLVSGLPKDGSLRLLALPFSAALGEGYSPAVLLAEDYPALIPPQAVVETVAVRAILITTSEKGGEETARRVAKHVPALFDAISRLAVSHSHPRWRDVNLGAVLPGWSRVPAAEAWLSQAFERQKSGLRGQFEEFLRKRKEPASSELSTVRRKKLFDEFQSWARKSITSETASR